VQTKITNSEENGPALKKGLEMKQKNHPYTTKHHEGLGSSGTDTSVLHNNVELHRYSRQQFTVLTQTL